MTVIVERRGPVLVITINRPEARNAVNAAVAEGIGDALELAHTDPVKAGWGFGGICEHPIDKPIIAAVNGFAVGDAAQAQEWGLVNRVVPDSQVLPVALEIAAAIASRAPLAVQATKRVVAGIVDGVAVADQESWSRAKTEAKRNRATEDAREGPRAFAEKRPSVWVGR